MLLFSHIFNCMKLQDEFKVDLEVLKGLELKEQLLQPTTTVLIFY